MRKIVFIIVCIITFVSCESAIKLSGNETVKDLNILDNNVEGIAVQDGFEVYLTCKNEQNVKIFADEQIISSVKHETRNGIMYFYKDSGAEFPNSASVKIQIYTDSVSIIKSLNSTIYIVDTLKTDSLVLECFNLSLIKGEIECQKLDVITNSSTIYLTGSAGNAVMNVSGGSVVGVGKDNPQKLWNGINTVNSKLNISGGSIVNINIENELEIYARENSIMNYATAGVFRSVILDDDSEIILQK
ncbi:MAG: DUF2807 domain-containing protein [Prevotellaceae bacterium]|jgi:hypothetical protein|nr:DUF2807 domain-containing protein [Prevotellaceae bacterium]